ncbi:hypothetical protein [Sorangium sp. So ce590]|uniref:hypothetical protein n=1 Tax=unclassified Sorangium TaxID=2621164 RepID=UPI003F5DCCE4
MCPSGGTDHTTGPEAFYPWYQDDPTVNVPIPYVVPLKASERGFGHFWGEEFFPIDDQGWGNEGREHDFGFTYELHMTRTGRATPPRTQIQTSREST